MLQNKLNNNQTILYPTDTVWGIGCDATSEEAVKKKYNIKKREETKSLVILVSSLEMLKQYVAKVPQKALEILEKATNPTTIVLRSSYSNSKKRYRKRQYYCY